MSIQGKQKEQKDFVKELFVGFTSVSIAAINPTRDELNDLLGKESTPEDKPIEYLGADNDGKPRVRLAFWLKDEKTGKYYVYSFNITKKERQNKDKTKVQIINATCGTSWVPYIDGTDKPNEDLVQDWFKNFISKEKEFLGPKKWRKALSGEEELANLTRAWLGRLNFSDPDTIALFDTDTFFKGNFKELRSLINADYDTPFVVLLGVKTDEDDTTKKYQQVWGKQFLPNGFMKYIQNDFKFPSDYSKKVWTKFEEEVGGEHGFDAFYQLVPLKSYNEAEDISGSDRSKETAKNSADY
jgi:hypothetical protein